MYRTYKWFLELVFLMVLISYLTIPMEVNANSQNLDHISEQAEQYLRNKFGNQSDTKIRVQAPQDDIDLPECQKLEFFTSSNPSQMNGNMRVTARCYAPKSWTIYLSANVSQKKTYYISRSRLEPGTIIRETDLTMAKDFPENLPFAVLTDPQLIVGKSVINIIEAGTPMIGPGLKNEYVINFGQIVKISVGGSGFKINTEGKAMNSAVLGQSVQVKMASGQVINGIARSGGLVEVSR
jgi:flagellar basal body P-ring formation protein FlgA